MPLVPGSTGASEEGRGSENRAGAPTGKLLEQSQARDAEKVSESEAAQPPRSPHLHA